jgi:lipoyl(octanoyl) transferase
MSPEGARVPADLDWGVREYGDALAEMRRLRAARRRGEIGDTLILVEHPAVITVGVQGDDGESFPDGLPVHRVERGGKSTFHGPGQLVGYPIVDLDPRGRDVRRFVGDVEEIVIQSLGSLGLAAARVSGRRGVWVDGSRKIASIGVAVEEWVTFHGFALNASTDLETFAAFHPCGFDGRIMTSVSRELGRPVSVESMKGPVRSAWAALFEPSGPVAGSGLGTAVGATSTSV